MNNFIKDLSDFLFDFTDFLESNKFISPINKKQISIDYSSNNKQGDLATNLYLIVRRKIINENFNIEKELNERIKSIGFIDYFVVSKNGFINFFLKDEFVLRSLKEIYSKNFLNYINYGAGKKINVEFVSANPTGPLHIAHIRGAVFGDVLSSLYTKTGFDVTREYYVNDAGSQIDKLSNSLLKRYLQLFDKKIELEEDEYPGEYLIDIAKKIKNEDDDKWLNFQQEETIQYFKNFALKNILLSIKSDLELINIRFDKFTHETEIEKSKIIDELFSILDEKKLLYEGILEKPKGDDSDWEPREQLLFRSSKLLDNEDRALKKSNGEWTYFANDAAYHLDKCKRNFDRLVNIWGSDHIGYIPRMNSLIKAIKDDETYLNILTCQIVSLIQNKQKIKMSKRSGNFVTLANVYSKVGKDPIRYYMISTKNETAIDFDLDAVVEKNKDNKVFYCQYAHARASSVINKANELGIKIKNDYNFSAIQNLSDEEVKLIKKLICYPYLLYQSSYYNEPHRLINYLEEISSDFHSIWNKGKDNESLRFIDEKNAEKTISKIFWLESFRVVLKDIFSIIDISAPETM